MVEISQLIESALGESQASLRKAALRTLSKMSPELTLREMLESEVGPTLKTATLADFRDAVAHWQNERSDAETKRSNRRVIGDKSGGSADPEAVYLSILECLQVEPQSVAHLAVSLGLEIDELRGYLDWMQQVGKVVRTGKGRGTRYQLPA